MDINYLITGIIFIAAGILVMVLMIVLHAKRERSRSAERSHVPYIVAVVVGLVLVIAGAITIFQGTQKRDRAALGENLGSGGISAPSGRVSASKRASGRGSTLPYSFRPLESQSAARTGL